MTYICTICGEPHDELPHLGTNQPDQWWSVPEAERDQRTELGSDTCIIDDEHYFIRGIIQLPIHGHDNPLGFNVWVSQRRDHFETYLANFENADVGPFFGWLCTQIDCFDTSTMFLKTMVHFRGGGLRPLVQLEPTNHPFAVAQRDGISLDDAWRIVHHYAPT